METPTDLDAILRGVLDGDRAKLGRAITLVESNRPDHRHQAQEMLTRLLPHTGAAQRIGISGVPGVGKSSFIERFGMSLLDQGHRVAVLAVDPTSSITGGSILGDKTRMERLATSDGAFVRPSPTGGTLGGVARTTRESILVCEAAGFDIVIVETVGVGQSEAVVADMVDTFVLLELAGAGDELQGIKRGILELVHIIAINKADGANRESAELARTELQRALRILRPPTDDDPWTPRVVLSSALTGDGIDEIWNLILEHRRLLEEAGIFQTLRDQQRVDWMWSLVDQLLLTAVREHPEVTAIADQIETAVLEGHTTPTAAAERILSVFGLER